MLALLAMLAVLAAVTTAYVGSLSAPFVSDDHVLIESNPRVLEARPIHAYFTEPFWSRSDAKKTAAYYRPVVSLSYVLDHRLWSGAPRGFHLTNLLAHLACCALLYLLCLRAGANPVVAGLASAGFGLFPRSTEAVTWISGRTDVLATLGVLGALCLHRSEASALPRRLAAAGVLGLALLAKEVALAGALAILCLEVLALRDFPATEGRARIRRCASNLVPVFAVVLVYAALRMRFAEIGAEVDPFGLWLRMIFAFQAFGTYLLMLLDPLRPATLIGKLGVIDPLPVLLGAVVASGISGTAGLLVARRAPPLAMVALCLVAAPLALVAHVIPVPLPSVAADRFLYLPAAGIALAAALGAHKLPERATRPVMGVALVLLLAFGAATWVRNLDWQDEMRFWKVAAQRGPATASEPYKELGTRHAWLGDPALALAHYRHAMDLEGAFSRRYPGVRVDPLLRANTALVLSELGSYDVAGVLLEQLVYESPRRADLRLNLAAVYARRFEFEQSTRELDSALRLYPGYPLAHTIRRQVRRASELWESLPEERSGEAIGARARRAEVFELIGRLTDADRVWAQVADAPDAGAPEVLQAAQYLARHGRDRSAAERALGRLHELDEPQPALEQTLRARITRGAL